MICGVILLTYQINNTWVSINEGEEITGCDSFGYARQADLFRQSKNSVSGLNTSIRSDFQKILQDWASQTRLPENDWYQMIAPHAHHFRKGTGETINQYPPGTGWLLSHFNQGRSRRTLWIISYTIISSLFLSLINKNRAVISNLAITLMGLGCLYVTNSYVSRSDSIGPSCALAAILSFCTIKTLNKIKTDSNLPLYLISLIGTLTGLSLSLRPGNIVFIICWLPILSLYDSTEIKRLLKAFLILLSSFLVGGIPFFAANQINTGSFISTTYSYLDTQFALGKFFENTSRLYIDGTLIIISLLITFLFTIIIWRQTSSDSLNQAKVRLVLILSWSGMLFMALVMLSKAIFIPYYIAPQVVMTLSLVGMSSCLIDQQDYINFRNFSKHNFAFIITSLAVLLLGGFHIQVPALEARPDFHKGRQEYVVWAGGLGSKLYYYHSINTAKLNFGTTKAREEIISYLSERKVKQYILDDEFSMKNIFDQSSKGSLREISSYRNKPIYEFVPDD